MQKKHCCLKMEGVIEEHNTPLLYEPYTREYCMQYQIKKPHKYGVIVAETLNYCPWCATELPKSLMEEWTEIVQEKFGVTDTLDREQLKKIPKEFMTDEWWKKRGL